jgi:hypothetical protein
MRGSDAAAFDCARQYRESFDVTASNVSFEWQQIENEKPVLHMRGLPEPEIPRRVSVPDFAGRCRSRSGSSPARFTMRRICRSCRAPATAGRIRIWRTTS